MQKKQSSDDIYSEDFKSGDQGAVTDNNVKVTESVRDEDINDDVDDYSNDDDFVKPSEKNVQLNHKTPTENASEYSNDFA